MGTTFCIGDWRVDTPLRTLSGKTGDVHLEPKQMQVLVVLAERAGEVVSKESLLKQVWPDTFVGDEVLSKAVSELRRAFNDDPKAPRFIQTIPKGGYRLVAPVRFDDGEQEVVPPGEHDGARRTKASRWTRWVPVLAVGGVGALAVAIPAFFPAPRPATPSALRTVPFTSFRGTEGSPTFSPEGTRLAFDWNPDESETSHIFVKLVGDDPPQQLTHGQGHDLSPSWSPDGRFIAFNRLEGEQSGLFLIPALGGAERKVLATLWQNVPWQCASRPRWSPDGRWLVFAAPTGETCQVQVLSLETFERRAITWPVAPAFDAAPAFSPDGQTIAFIRFRSFGLGNLHVVRADGASPTIVTRDQADYLGQLAWTPDGKSIILSASRPGSAALWRVDVAGGSVERLPVGGDWLGDCALDSTGRRLAYVQVHEDPEIYQLNLDRPAEPLRRIASSSQWEHGPHFSPDGKKIAFESARGGPLPDVWVADADGGNPTRLTHFDGYVSGTPRWSPDGRRIAFDSNLRNNLDIFVVSVLGGRPTPLTSEPAEDAIPSWSNDGRWIYFTSARTGQSQLWKMLATGGAAVQLTKNGGYGGFESADGHVYYSKGERVSGIWRVPLAGGLEEPVLPDAPGNGYSRYWALANNGLYFLNSSQRQRPSVQFFDLATRRTTQVATLPRPASPWSSGLAVSPDGRRLLVVLTETKGADIVLVENFH